MGVWEYYSTNRKLSSVIGQRSTANRHPSLFRAYKINRQIKIYSNIPVIL